MRDPDDLAEFLAFPARRLPRLDVAGGAHMPTRHFAQRWLARLQQRSRVLLHRNARRDALMLSFSATAPAPGWRWTYSGLVVGLCSISPRGVRNTGVNSKAGSLWRARGSSASCTRGASAVRRATGCC